MHDQIEIRVGGVGLLFSRGDAASVVAQLAKAGIVAGAVASDDTLIIGDDHPMWSLHSGGSRHDAPDWDPADEQLAEAQYRLPPLTAKFHRTLMDYPGQLLSVEDLARLTDGALSNSRVIAGAFGLRVVVRTPGPSVPFLLVGRTRRPVHQVCDAATSSGFVPGSLA